MFWNQDLRSTVLADSVVVDSIQSPRQQTDFRFNRKQMHLSPTYVLEISLSLSPSHIPSFRSGTVSIGVIQKVRHAIIDQF